MEEKLAYIKQKMAHLDITLTCLLYTSDAADD